MNPRHSRAHALQQEKPVHWRATPTRESPCVTVIPSAARKREKIEKKKGGGNEILPFARTWMELEGFMLNGVSPTEQHMLYDTTCV